MSRLLGWIGVLLPWSCLASLLWLEGVPSFSMSPRQGGLLIESLLAACFAGALAVLLGGGAAFYAMALPARRLSSVSTLLALGAALPPIITASAVLSLFGRISPWLSQGWTPALVVQALTLAPLAGLILLLTLLSLSGDEVDSASVFLSEGRRLTGVILPLCLPGIVAAFAAASTLALLDFTVPTLFGLTTSMVEVYSDLTAGRRGLTSAWPHFLAALPCVMILSLWLSSKPGAMRGDLRQVRVLALPPPVQAGATVTAVGLCLSFGFVISLLIFQGLDHPHALQSVTEALPDLGSSAALACLTGLVTIPLAALSGKLLSRSRSLFLWIAALAPASIPPALVGTAVAQASVSLGVEGTAAPVAAQVLRFLPIASVVSALWWARQNQEVEDSSLVFLSPVARFLRATLPGAGPQLAALFVVVFALSLGELGATLLVIPPGESTLTLKLYNFLHYGSAPDSAMLTLLLLLCASLPPAVLLGARRLTRA